MVYSKKKEFAPRGVKFFPFGIDHFQKNLVCRKANRRSQSLSFFKTNQKIISVYQVPLSRMYMKFKQNLHVLWLLRNFIMYFEPLTNGNVMLAALTLCNVV